MTPVRAPRHGAFARTWGAIAPAGPRANRSRVSRALGSAERMHFRSGLCLELFPGESRGPVLSFSWPQALGSIEVLLRWVPFAGVRGCLLSRSLGGFRNSVLPGLF